MVSRLWYGARHQRCHSHIGAGSFYFSFNMVGLLGAKLDTQVIAIISYSRYTTIMHKQMLRLLNRFMVHVGRPLVQCQRSFHHQLVKYEH